MVPLTYFGYQPLLRSTASIIISDSEPKKADAIVVAPASAESLSQMARGGAHDLVSACVLSVLRTPFGKRRFEYREGKLFQNSMVEADLSWECLQVKDVINPQHPRYNKADLFSDGTQGQFLIKFQF